MRSLCTVRALRTALLVMALLVSVALTIVPVGASGPPFPGRWIDINLTAFSITAFDGGKPVYTAPVTSGKPGYETPTGTFAIAYRVYNETMDSETLGVPRWAPEGYYLRDVLYTQYFTGDGLAIHSNYWAPDWVFGKANVSHGCVAMRTADAAFFWNFASIGTPIYIHHGPSVPDSASAPAPRATPPPPPTPSPVRPPEKGLAWVPDLVGLTVADAQRMIEEAGLRTTYVNYQTESDVPEALRGFYNSIQPGCVLSATPRPGDALPVGSVVRIAARAAR